MTRQWEPLLEQVVRERYPALLARALLLVRERHAAEDLVQDAVVSAFSGRARFTSVEHAEGYVRRAIVSRFIDGTRRRGRETAALGRIAARPEPVADDLADLGLTGELELALAALPPRERACVVLRHLDDLSVRETADVLGLSEGAVKRYVSDAVRTLSSRLDVSVPSDDATTVLLTVNEVDRGA
ncbi:sigma-70 family RNA polymerase sigma factor [uncultured Cellulomonas sp.]|uniref:RNA polymerase sigma factor n=1 Tax=uncultured Cellulomonas sp. TaxID=189682 RepID=UPI0028E54560|nr:sigma-70 family RNA polymerase sigma factor [uncultured Cellulomonas sp.]